MPLEVPSISSLLLKSFSAGQFHVVLDGGFDAGYVKSVSGGAARGEVISEALGSDMLQYKHLGTVDIEPLNVELGMGVSRNIIKWIRSSWMREFSRKNGAVMIADDKYRERFQLNFYDSLITETTFPTLDGSSNEPAYLKVQMQPESVELKRGKVVGFRPPTLPWNQTQWTQSNFRLWIQGLDCTRVSKIDSFTVKQHVNKLYVGRSRFPEIEPSGIEFPNLTVYTSAAFLDPWIKWHKEYVLRGGPDTKHHRQGFLEFVGFRGQPLFLIGLENIGISSIELEPGQAGSDKIKRAKVELFVEKMEMKPASMQI